MKRCATLLSLVFAPFFTTQSASAYVAGTKCESAYHVYINEKINGDTWLAFQVGLLRNAFEGGGMGATFFNALLLAELPVYPLVWPTAAAHDLFFKIKRAIHNSKYKGVIQSYDLQHNISMLVVDYYLRYKKDIDSSPEALEAALADLSTLVNLDVEDGRPYGTYDGSPITSYHTLINSEAFLTLAAKNNVPSDNYPAFVKRLIHAVYFEPVFCGPGEKPAIKPLTELQF